MSDRHAKRYAAYKESGVEWLGKVPEPWALQRHKDCFYFISDRCADSTFLKVGLENIEGKTGRFIPTETEFDGDGIQFKKDDILFGKLRPYLAKVYLAEFRGNSVGDIFVYRCKRNTLPKFARYLMLSDLYIDVINSSTAGAKMPRVSSSFITDLPVAMPSIVEQSAIIFYLDTKTAQIDRQIELLNKKATQHGKLKQSLINETVTHGLDNSVPMKESGVEWIGKVPAHWDVKRGVDFLGLSSNQVDTNEMSNQDVFHYSIPVVQEIGTGRVEDGSDIESNKVRIAGEELLYSKLNPRKETVCITKLPLNGQLSVASGEFLVLKPFPGRSVLKFCYYLFCATFNKERICSTVKSATKSHQRANPNDIHKLSFAIPSLLEQTAIAAYLDTKTAQIDRIVSTINTQIDKLKELRKTLINDVVTGKIKVIPEGELA